MGGSEQLRRRRHAEKPQGPDHTLELVGYEDLPEWMRDNEYILKAYRPHMERWRDCVRTALFNWHNESINVWSHMIGFLFFLALTVYTVVHLTAVDGHFGWLTSATIAKYGGAVHALQHAEEVVFETLRHAPATFHGCTDLARSVVRTATRNAEQALVHAMPGVEGVPAPVLQEAFQKLLYEHRVGMMPMLLGATGCCLGSALYHMLWNHSSTTLTIFSRLDYCGIVALIAGHSMMGTYYTWYCRPYLAIGYSVFVGCAAVPVLASFAHPRFASPSFRTTRTVLFILFAVVSACPVVHSGLMHRFVHHEFVAHLKFLVVACAFYLAGGILFASRWPERINPGRFDLVLNSHQLLHLCVLIGAFLHWYGSYLSLVYRLTHGCSRSPLAAAE